MDLRRVAASKAAPSPSPPYLIILSSIMIYFLLYAYAVKLYNYRGKQFVSVATRIYTIQTEDTILSIGTS